MTRARNPFRATLGATPPLLVGRSEAVQNFAFALDDGPGAHERISLIVGPRGIGKTVLLHAFEDTAQAHHLRRWRLHHLGLILDLGNVVFLAQCPR